MKACFRISIFDVLLVCTRYLSKSGMKETVKLAMIFKGVFITTQYNNIRLKHLNTFLYTIECTMPIARFIKFIKRWRRVDKDVNIKERLTKYKELKRFFNVSSNKSEEEIATFSNAVEEIYRSLIENNKENRRTLPKGHLESLLKKSIGKTDLLKWMASTYMLAESGYISEEKREEVKDALSKVFTIYSVFTDQESPEEEKMYEFIEQSLPRDRELAVMVVRELVGRLGDEDEVVMWRSVDALGKILPHVYHILPEELVKETVRELVKRSMDYDEEIRESFAKALGNILEGTSSTYPQIAKEVVQKLARGLADTYWRVRWSSADVIGYILPQVYQILPEGMVKEIVQKLKGMLRDKDREVREASAKALGNILPHVYHVLHKNVVEMSVQELAWWLNEEGLEVEESTAKALNALMEDISSRKDI